MTIVKSAKFREQLAKLLQASYDEDIFIDYYGQLFQITPAKSKTKKQTKTQKIIEHFKNLKPRKLSGNVFNEADPAQEKANIRNLIYPRYDK